MAPRRARSFLALAILVSPGFLSGAAHAFSGTVLRGFGTATLDGAMGPGEWDGAGHVDFTVNRSSSQGGGTVPATLYVMNDIANLYVGVKVANATVGASRLAVEFDNNHDDNVAQEGEDYVRVDSAGTFIDMFTHQIAPGAWQAVRDIDYGGTTDGNEWDGDNPGFSFYELSHPLDDLDNAHDFSLRVPQRIGFSLSFNHCSPCAETSYFPNSRSRAEIVIVSGSRVPPDTQLSVGPVEGSLTATYDTLFEFTGTDDVLSATDLVYECKVDEDDWSTCPSPYAASVDDGHHTFFVRAVDEMLNADPTPAQRSWSIDSTGPSRPRVRGPRVARTRMPVYRFAARDEVTPPGRIRFRCAFDSTRLHRCAAKYRQRLRPGRHVLRVEGVDSLGNIGDRTTLRIRVKASRH